MSTESTGVKPSVSEEPKPVSGQEAAVSGDKGEEKKTQPQPPPAVPAKKREPKNWDAILKQIEKEEEEAGEKDVGDVFKQLYEKADDDTRRAMNKSYYESNGTTLSMNWGEVGKKKVKPYDEDKKHGHRHCGSDSDSD